MVLFLIDVYFSSKNRVNFRNLNHYSKYRGQRKKFSVNLGHNILEVFNVLEKFPFTTSKADLISSTKNVVYELPHELPNKLRPRILGN